MGLSSLVLLGCTALMRANSLKHPSGCLQFAQMGERMEKEEHGMYVSRRKERKERDSDHLVHVFVYGLIIDESEGVV